MIKERPTFGIVAPCYNEETVIISFLNELLQIIQKCDGNFHIIIVDDGSIDSTRDKLESIVVTLKNVEISILLLNRNLGHQNAISEGLYFAYNQDLDFVIVMDSDGEDDPQAILELIKLTDQDIVFVSRGKRTESIKFIIFYFLYKGLFFLITGKKVNFGNYSMISRRILKEIGSERFIHFPAFISKLNHPKHFIKYDRRHRIDGSSKMNFDSLVLHGFKSFIEYAENLFFFFLKMFFFLFSGIFIGSIIILYKKYVLKTAILGWTSSLMLSLLIMAILCIGFFVIGLMQLYSFKKIDLQSRTPVQSTYKLVKKIYYDQSK